MYEAEEERLVSLKPIPHTELWHPDDDEAIQISPFELPEEIKQGAKTIQTLPTLDAKTANDKEIRALFVITDIRSGVVHRAAFQSLYRGNLLTKRKSFFLSGDMLDVQTSPALTLPSQISALYMYDGRVGKLIFPQWRMISRFMDVADYYKQATNDEVKQVMEHQLFTDADVEAVLKFAGSRLRRRFALLKEDAVLDKLTADEIVNAGAQYQLVLEKKHVGGKDRIVFPKVKDNVEDLVKLLSEEFFEGCLTKQKYVTNSKRPKKK